MDYHYRNLTREELERFREAHMLEIEQHETWLRASRAELAAIEAALREAGVGCV